MTTANKITIGRILLIPVFVVLAIYYGESVEAGRPNAELRYASVLVFLVAAASDGLDGYIARRYQQRSRLGAVLDPIADKGLLLAALLTLTFSHWEDHFPSWFAVLVIARDSIIVVGSFVIHFINGDVQVHPRWSGKCATVFQMVAIAWVMLQLPFVATIVPVYVAGFFTLLSGIWYIIDGVRQLQRSEDLAKPG